MFKKIALTLIALVALYLGAALTEAALALKAHQQVVADVARLASLAEKATLPEPVSSLAEACASLPRVGRTQLLAIYPVPAEGVLIGDDARNGYEAPRVMGLEAARFEVAYAALPLSQWDLKYWLMQFLSDAPPYWGMYSQRAFSPFTQPISDAKYLVVHQLTSLDMPSTHGTTYTPGHMRFHSAVLDAQSGQVLCHGTTAIDQSGSIGVAASGSSKAAAELALEEKSDAQVRSLFFIELLSFSMRDVCWLADESICKLTFGTFRPPP